MERLRFGPKIVYFQGFVVQHHCKLLLLLLATACFSSSVVGQSQLPYGAEVMDQSTYALGTMQWNVIFVEGDGSNQTQRESWTSAEIANLQTKISGAADYWEGLTSGFHQNARLSIDINYVNGGNAMTTGYEPTTDQSEIWVNDVMGTLGYNQGNRFNNVRNFNQDTRVAAQTHWAATVFIMDNTEAGLASYAYARYGGPYTVLTHDAAGWTPANFNMVLAHEFGHIFNGLDEYAGSGQRRNYRGGYLNVENGNASLDEDGNTIIPPQPNALMRNNGNFNTHEPYAPSEFSSAMFGHRDTDGDSIPDILDTNPFLEGNDSASSGFEFSFEGLIEVSPLTNNNPLNPGFSNSGNDITINTIQSAFYSIDGGEATAFGAMDGSFGDYLESLSFTTGPLAAGVHTIDVFGFNSVDNESNRLTFNFTAVPEPSALAICIFLAGGIGIRRRRV